MSIQCRTMLSQRPCGSLQCTREECSGARVSASVLATIPDTENDVTGSESAPQSTSEGEPTYTLTGLSARDVERIAHALRMLRRIYTRESSMYEEVSELGSRVIAVRKGE